MSLAPLEKLTFCPDSLTLDRMAAGSYNQVSPGSPPPDYSSLAAQDVTAGSNGFYVVDDLLGDLANQVVYGGSGNTFLNYGTPGGVPTLPTGFPVSTFANHPGIHTANTGALNDFGGLTCGPGQFFVVNPSSPTTTWNGIAYSPSVLTTADAVTWQIGPGFLQNGGLYHGWALQQNPVTNSGNIQLVESQAGSGSVIGNSTQAFAPGVWYKTQIVIKGTQVTGYVNGVQVVQGTSAVLNASANSGMIITKGCHYQKRTAFASGTIWSFLDRVSLSMAAAGR